jgi:hypothetical protein
MLTLRSAAGELAMGGAMAAVVALKFNVSLHGSHNSTEKRTFVF